MTNRDEQKEQRRIQILEAALDLFIRKGYGETKIADIADAADMSMGLLFHYFESKEKLYEVLVRSGCERMKMEMAYTDGSPLEFFQAAAESVLAMIASNPSSAKMFVLMEQAQHLDILSAELKDMLSESNKLIEYCIPLIELGQSSGEINDGNPEALSVAFWCSIQGIAQHMALLPKTPCPEPDWILSILKKEKQQ